MEKLPNYYELLHVQRDAPAPVIKASYRAMMQKMRLHPDLGGDEGLAQQLNQAVATLCNQESREQYDRLLAASRKPRNSAGGTPDCGTPFREPQNDEPTRSNRYAKSGAAHAGEAHTGAGKAYAASSEADITDRIHLPTRKQCPFCHAASASSKNGVFGYENHQRCAQCKGATTPIESISLGSADDIRKIYRHSHESQVWLQTEWPLKTAISATMTDLSIAGCAIRCANTLNLQSVILLDTQMFNSICQVRYQKQLGPTELYSIGLEFLTLDIFATPGSVFSATA